MDKGRILSRIFLLLLHFLLKLNYSNADSCVDGIQLDGQFDKCSCKRINTEGHISLNCEYQRWITVPNFYKSFLKPNNVIPNIAAITIKKGFLMYISQDAFRNTSTQLIDLSHNFIENINVNAFRGLEHKLYQLSLSHNSLSAIPYHSLTYLHELQYLYLQQNQISEITPQTFSNVKLNNLKFLHLDKNKINVLQKGSLIHLPLQVLTISNNKIVDIEKDALPKTIWFLDLKHNLLQTIPYLALKQLENLQTIDLEGNNITSIHQHKEVKFKNQITVLLSNNKIHYLSKEAFGSFTQINKLDISYNQITKIDDRAFKSITSLNEIDMSYNKISHIPLKTFENFSNSLKKINLEENDLHSLPLALKQLKVLEVLNLNSNKLTDLQNNVMYNFKQNITELLLAYNRLTSIPHDVLEGMTQLKYLDLSKNRIKDIDEIAFGSLPNLIRLNLAGNYLKKITNNYIFDSLRSLAYLDLSHNRLRELGKTSIEKLTGLESLFLQNNALTEFPRSALSGLDKLRYLLLDHNRIETLPNFAVQWLTHLERLSLSRNGIESIGEKTFRAAPMQLKSLNLGFNKISELSSRAFDSLPSLEQLFLNNNHLTRILPQTVTNLNALRDLILSHNKISEISEYSFVNLPQLEGLSLSNNQIRTIPVNALSSTSKLEFLDLSFNNIKHFTSDFLGNNIKLSYLNIAHNKISRFDIINLKQYLEKLIMHNNRIQYLSSDKLTNFEKLQYIDLSANEIIEIDHDFFISCPKLTVINLSHNNIRKLWKGTFNIQHKIQQLFLSNNYLNHVDHGIFGKNNVIELYLQNNNFTSIPKEALTSIRESLTILDLSGNNIKSIGRKDLIGLQNITRLILSNNQIESIDDETFADLPLIQYLDLSNNPITTWSPHAFKSISQSISFISLAKTGLFTLPRINSRSLLHLNISHNNIYEINKNDIETLKRLHSLDASWNNIAEIKAPVFKEMQDLKYLDLNGNSMTSIDTELIEQLDQLETLKISHLKNLEKLPSSFEFAKIRNLKHLEIHTLPLPSTQYNITSILQVLPPLKTLDVEIKETELNTQFKKADMRLLRSLTIRGKDLEKIHPHAFSNLRGYRFELKITGTKLQEIPALTFHTLHMISFLRLSLRNNEIHQFNPFTYTKLPLINQHGTILESIDLRDNPVLCTCEFRWLRPWIEYTTENSDDIKSIETELDEAKCDAKPGDENTLLSVYGADIPGIQSKHIATQTIDKMCRQTSSSKPNAFSLLLASTLIYIFA